MRFFAVAATFAGVAAAHYGSAVAADETCSLVTVTVTETLKHTPTAPASGSTSSAAVDASSVQSPHGGVGYPPSSSAQAPYGGVGYPAGPSSAQSPHGGVGYPVSSSAAASSAPSSLSVDASTAKSPYGGVGYPAGPSSAQVPHGGAAPPLVTASFYGTGVPSGVARPTGTGASNPPIPEFSGAASNIRVGGLMAGVAGVAAMLL